MTWKMTVQAVLAQFVKEKIMFDYEWKSGLVFGLDTDSIYVVDEEEEINTEQPPSTIITLYLGIIAFHLIIR